MYEGVSQAVGSNRETDRAATTTSKALPCLIKKERYDKRNVLMHELAEHLNHSIWKPHFIVNRDRELGQTRVVCTRIVVMNNQIESGTSKYMEMILLWWARRGGNVSVSMILHELSFGCVLCCSPMIMICGTVQFSSEMSSTFRKRDLEQKNTIRNLGNRKPIK